MKRFLDDFLLGKASYTELLTDNRFYVNQDIAELFGTSSSTQEIEMKEVSFHRGFLSHPLILMRKRDGNESNIITRGSFVADIVLGFKLGEGVVVDEEDILDAERRAKTRREEVEILTEGSCQVCHGMINPPGFALESFDYLGRYRTTIQGKDIDASGVMPSMDDLSFDDFQGFITGVGQNHLAYKNFVYQLFTFYFGKSPSPDELAKLLKSFEDEGYHLKPLLIQLFTGGQ
jgi:hypothetical protein